MAGFRKAKAEQAALKVGMYGLPGSGKTFTALLCAEGLAKLSGKRVAFVDTERGTDFYVQAVKARSVHPEAFDVDALYSRSITEITTAIRSLDPNVYCCVVIDSVTHIWEAARAAYAGKENKAGQIPFHAWGKIKKPYKELMQFLLNSPLHVFILGRQGNEFAEDEETGETKKVGVKMKAEGETPYEPHILIHMESVKDNGRVTITAYAEKDRTGVLAMRTIENPCFDNLIKPLLGLLGKDQAKMQSESEAATLDAETLQAQEEQRSAKSAEHLRVMSAKIELSATAADLRVIGKEITPELKSEMTTEDVATLRQKYLDREASLKGTEAKVA